MIDEVSIREGRPASDPVFLHTRCRGGSGFRPHLHVRKPPNLAGGKPQVAEDMLIRTTAPRTSPKE